MKLFLDIDGVMVLAKPWQAPTLLEDGFPMFSPNAVSSLNQIVSRYNPNVVLTTSHRHRFGIDVWKRIFQRRAIEISKLERTPPSAFNSNRKKEILDWFSSRQIDNNFLIIDDDKSLNGLPTHLKDRLIQPSPYIGLSSANVISAIDIIETSVAEAQE